MSQAVDKTYDLKNAYKQYGVRSHDRALLRIAVWDPVAKQGKLMAPNALPVGAVAP